VTGSFMEVNSLRGAALGDTGDEQGLGEAAAGAVRESGEEGEAAACSARVVAVALLAAPAEETAVAHSGGEAVRRHAPKLAPPSLAPRTVVESERV
jgi:hypothetical protein